MGRSNDITLEELENLRRGLARAYVAFGSWDAVGKRLLGKSGAYAWRIVHDPGFEPSPAAVYHWREFWLSLPEILWGTTAPLKEKALAIISASLGPENAVSVERLAKSLSVIPRRARATVRALRKDRYPICTALGKGGGYFWPVSLEQFWEYHKRFLWSRAADLIDTCGGMEMDLARWFPQRPAQLELFQEAIDGQTESASVTFAH